MSPATRATNTKPNNQMNIHTDSTSIDSTKPNPNDGIVII